MGLTIVCRRIKITTPVLTSNHRLHIIKPIEIVGNTKIPAEAQHNKNRNAKHPLFLLKNSIKI